MEPTEADQQRAFDRLQKRAVDVYLSGVAAIALRENPLHKCGDEAMVQLDAGTFAIAAGMFAARARDWFLDVGVRMPSGYTRDEETVNQLVAEMMDVGERLARKIDEMDGGA